MNHSAEVRVHLDCGEHGIVPLARLTPRSVVAKVAPRVPPSTYADIVVTVDGERHMTRVFLPRGFRGRVARVRTEA